jgi:hypothetical protein
MPIFGQVWLWSSLAFLLGALLCWLLVARPARNRVGELEAQLASPARRPSAPDRPELDRRRDDQGILVPGIGDDEDFRTRSFGLRDTPPPLPPERGRLAPYVDQERGFPPPEHDVEQPPAAATQYLDVSSGSLAAPPEVPVMSPPPSDRGWFDDELEEGAADKAPEEQPAVPRNRHQLIEQFDARLVDDGADESDIAGALSDDEPRSAVEDESGGTVFTQRTHPIPGELIRQIDEAGKAERARAETDNLVDDLAEDPAETEFDRRDRTVESEAVAPPSGFTEPRFTEPESSVPTFPGQEPTFTEPERSTFAEPESSTPVFTEPERSTPTFSETDRPAAAFTEPEGSAPSSGEQAPAFGEQPAPSFGEQPAFGDVDRPAFTEPADPTPSFGRLAPAFAESGRPAHALNEPVAPTFDEQGFTEPAFTEPAGSAPEPLPQEQTEVVAATAPATEEPATHEPGTRSASNLPKRVPQQNRITQAVAVRVDPTPAALPKRVPSKPRHQVPFAVEPSSTPEPVASAAADQPAEAARSLFEPIIPAEDEGMSTPPPPHRLRQGSGGGRGPFGPGSAMPLPGGASPSPEFTIKASVAALRYCTPESPQFGRTVAEVWFRTAADAERVGFRPVG